jgi:hypothetical protein
MFREISNASLRLIVHNISNDSSKSVMRFVLKGLLKMYIIRHARSNVMKSETSKILQGCFAYTGNGERVKFIVR